MPQYGNMKDIEKKAPSVHGLMGFLAQENLYCGGKKKVNSFGRVKASYLSDNYFVLQNTRQNQERAGPHELCLSHLMNNASLFIIIAIIDLHK